MQNFEYYTPTRVLFGKDTELEVGNLLKREGCQKILIHYGGESAKKTGLLDRVTDSVKKAGIPFVSLGGVVPNPRLSKVYEGIELCKNENVDFILAVGGGSVIDSAKAIAYGVVYEGDVWDFYLKKKQPEGALPVGAIVTIAAAGSEMSDSSVITNEKSWLKRGCNNNHSRCRFAIMNPELTYTLPQYQTASGCVDILMHTLERYFTHETDTRLTTEIAEALLKTVMDNSQILMKNPRDYNARAQIMWAGSLSHNGLTGCGTVGDWSCHRLEHELGGMFDVAHGAGLSALWGSWARYVYDANIIPFVKLAVNVLGVYQEFHDPEKTALAGIEKMEDYFRSLNMPTTISELGIEISDEQIDEMAYKCSIQKQKTIGTIKELSYEDMKKIYTMAK